MPPPCFLTALSPTAVPDTLDGTTDVDAIDKPFAGLTRGESISLASVMPEGDWLSLPSQCGPPWAALAAGQQRTCIVLFDMYADRCFGAELVRPSFRSLSADGFARLARELFCTGPKLVPLVPVHLVHGLYAAASVEQPACDTPFATKRYQRRPPRHLDFRGFIELLAAVAACWRDARQTRITPSACTQPPPRAVARPRLEEPTASAGVAQGAALGAMLHEIACSAYCTEVEQRLLVRQTRRGSASGTCAHPPVLKLWDLLLPDGGAEPLGAPRESDGRFAAGLPRPPAARALAFAAAKEPEAAAEAARAKATACAAAAAEAMAADAATRAQAMAKAKATEAAAGAARVGGLLRQPQAALAPSPRPTTARRLASPLSSARTPLRPRPPRAAATPRSSMALRASASAALDRSLLPHSMQVELREHTLREQMKNDVRREVKALVRSELAVASATLRASEPPPPPRTHERPVECPAYYASTPSYYASVMARGLDESTYCSQDAHLAFSPREMVTAMAPAPPPPSPPPPFPSPPYAAMELLAAAETPLTARPAAAAMVDLGSAGGRSPSTAVLPAHSRLSSAGSDHTGSPSLAPTVFSSDSPVGVTASFALLRPHGRPAADVNGKK